jgi:iron complex transport system ATP-binding protein
VTGIVKEQPIVEARGLLVTFQEKNALAQVTVDILPGRITAICGANGSGKSTLMKCLAGLETPSAGEITLMGRPLGAYTRQEIARQVAVVGQNPEVPAGFNVRELVAQGRYPHLPWLGRPGLGDNEAVDAAMARVGMAELRDREVATLSGGERQRAWLALALAQAPRVLFLDEPTSFLDIRHQSELLRLLRQLNHRDGLTIVAVLHDLNQVMDIADDVVLMQDGRILASGPTADVLTPKLMSDAFDCGVDLVPHPRDGRPFCLVDWTADDAHEKRVAR